MQHEAAAYLNDILIAVDGALRFTQGMDSDACAANDLVRLAVERELMIAGEALSQLARISPETVERVPDWRGIISFRNILVHGYRVLDHGLVFEIIRKDLPALRGVIADILSKLGQP